ncbi:GNAT family protein [Terrabacter aerolatus]|uniref:Putative succinyl-CoA transferase n=1 Tax=Terrabacter aerolatus TaxID=422442 RepID=A0A512CXA1_9MICO|nr:GNAT family N-acetyltransferase [Terrabacter aerolatus]GEO28842.1 putative succinyl-CoA transferase [Terrabacter aerolatus]
MGDWSWPLHGIRLRTADLDLRVMTEADLPALAALLPDDVEMNPHATRYAGLDLRANRRAVLAQGYWRALGLWSPDDWALPFVVRRDGVVVGAQWLEGPDWRTDRTVDSSSWLVVAARGRGLGTQMRAAVLALAFGPLRAEAAVSSAVLGNAGSLGVSRSLGYLDTHRSVLEHSGETLQHVRLTRTAWSASGRGGTDGPHGVVVDGVTPALPLFGIEGRP